MPTRSAWWQQDSVVDMSVSTSAVRLGLISLDYGPWRDVVEAAARWGLSLVELYVDISVVEDDLPNVAMTTQSSGVGVSSVSSLARLAQVEDPGELDVQLDLIRRSIDMAEELEAPFATLMHGGCGTLDRDAALERFVQRVDPLVERARVAGVTLLIENVFSRAVPGDFDEFEATAEAFEMLGPRGIGLNLDLGNFAVAGATVEPDAWECLLPHVRSTHLKNVERYDPAVHGDIGERRPLDGRVHGRHISVPIDRGKVDYGPLLDRLARGDLDVPVLLEPFAGGKIRDEWIDMSLDALERHGVVKRHRDERTLYER